VIEKIYKAVGTIGTWGWIGGLLYFFNFIEMLTPFGAALLVGASLFVTLWIWWN